MSILNKISQVLGLISSPKPPQPETDEQRGIKAAEERKKEIGERLSRRFEEHLLHNITGDQAEIGLKTGEKVITVPVDNEQQCAGDGKGGIRSQAANEKMGREANNPLQLRLDAAKRSREREKGGGSPEGGY